MYISQRIYYVDTSKQYRMKGEGNPNKVPFEEEVNLARSDEKTCRDLEPRSLDELRNPFQGPAQSFLMGEAEDQYSRLWKRFET